MFDNAQQTQFENRLRTFSKKTRDFINTVQYSIANKEYLKQVIRSSSSVAANYIEACESLTKKEFRHRIMISKKEAKETAFWLDLIEVNSENKNREKEWLIDEATQFVKIFSKTIKNTKI